MKILNLVWSVLSLAALSSCVPFWTARVVKNDLDRARTEATKYYRQEVMHNLVKAANGQMFVHVDITQLNSKANFSLNSTGTVNQSAVSTGAVTRLLSWNLVPGGLNEVNFNSSPVIDNPKLYSHYINFINLKPTSTSISSTSASASTPRAGRSAGLPSAAQINDIGKSLPADVRHRVKPIFESWLKATAETRASEEAPAKSEETPAKTLAASGSDTDVSDLKLSGVDAKKKNKDGLVDTLHYQPKPEDPSAKTPYISRKKRQIFIPFEEIGGNYNHDKVIYSICKSRQRPPAGTYIRETLLVPNRASYDLDDFDDPNEFYYWIPIECKEQYFEFCMAIVGRAATASGIPPQKAPIIVKSL